MAAGLGFKTFNTGDVLSAADVNGYLMQGVLVFADATARDAAITSPQEGQFAYTKDNNSLWYYSGSAWVASGATGDIEGVTAGVGISGGGTSGTVTVTNSMATAIDAKGDLVVGTGADTFSKLTVGANGTILTADSAEATGLKWATASTSFKGCQLWKSANQSISNATYTAITFDNENFDTDSFHSTSSNTSRITIPVGLDGKYLVTFTAGYNANSTGIRGSALHKNGALAFVMFQVSASSAADTFFGSSQIMNLSAGDYVELFLYQSSGGALDVKGITIDATTFSCQYLGA